MWLEFKRFQVPELNYIMHKNTCNLTICKWNQNKQEVIKTTLINLLLPCLMANIILNCLKTLFNGILPALAVAFKWYALTVAVLYLDISLCTLVNEMHCLKPEIQKTIRLSCVYDRTIYSHSLKCRAHYILDMHHGCYQRAAIGMQVCSICAVGSNSNTCTYPVCSFPMCETVW